MASSTNANIEASHAPPSPPISKELLEELTGCPVLTYLIQDGSNPGDNFMSVIYSVSAELVIEKEQEEPSKELHHFIFKCYPRHPSRQAYLNRTNLFYNELNFYKVWVEALHDFQQNYLEESQILSPAVPPCIGGRAIDFSSMKKTDIAEVFLPLDNFIAMTDLRKSCGFKMIDKAVGLDLEHLTLAFTELAKMHALSWAYQSKVEPNLLEKFPFLKIGIGRKDMEMWTNIVRGNVDIAIETFNAIFGDDNHLSKGTKAFQDNLFKVIELFTLYEEKMEKDSWNVHRDPPKDMVKASENEQQWRVICHGDAWSRNVLYKYDESTGKPKQIVIFDFQLARMACPIVDLSYLIYTSTTVEFRNQHMENLLKLYYDKFTEFCFILQVPPFPDFSIDSLKRRFHRAKIIGYMMACVAFPNLFLQKGKEVNLEQSNSDDGMEKIMSEAFGKGAQECSEYQKRIVEVAQDLYIEGVI